MEIAINSRVRLAGGLITGTVIEIGCDKCGVITNSKIDRLFKVEPVRWECEISELREPISTTLTNLRDKLEVKLIDFMADESGKSTLKVIGGILAGSIITIIAALIFK